MGGTVACPGKIIKNSVTWWYLVRLLPDTHNSPLLEPRCPALSKNELLGLLCLPIQFVIIDLRVLLSQWKKEGSEID